MAPKNSRYLSNLKHDDRHKINVGRDFQAVIPPLKLSSEDDSNERMCEDKLLWKPSRISECSVHNYLAAIKSYPHCKLDEERALFLLHQCDYDTEEAFRRLQLLPQPLNYNVTWSEEECKLFEKVLQTYGKRFEEVPKLVPARSVKDVVEFYYFWKRSERYDAFIKSKCIYGQSKNKKKKKKRHRSIDPADAILDEEEELLRDDERLIYPFFPLLEKMPKEREECRCGDMINFIWNQLNQSLNQVATSSKP